jgi:hypothetical protein
MQTAKEIADLTDSMLAEKEALESEVHITAVYWDEYQQQLSLETRHGEHTHKVVGCVPKPSIATMRSLLNASISIHARRLPKHQEFAALAKEVAA